MRPMIRTHDTANNEVIDREMNDEEFAQYKIDVANAKAKEEAKAQAQADKAAAEAKLAELGLTTDDLKSLGL